MNIIIARIKAGLTQKQLSKITGISHVTIGKLEKGNYDGISKGNMIKIAEALNSTVTELFFSNEE
ncbi:helix-turn-helix transcriptional regulator [Clostridium sp. UBA5712]|uniref:helix-turn-helix transcriptional regulator n=1 Tax=Clostridium sp. UBA5712 TaxID=1946368 RepID=UPI0032172D09